MLNLLWLTFFIIAFLSALGQWIFLGDSSVFASINNAIFAMAKTSVEIALGLIGVLAFWLGMMKIAEKSGGIALLSRLLSPLFSRLMPGVPKDHAAFGSITMNLSANMLGLDSAATPLGIKAMHDLQSLNPDKDRASNAQILFLVLNTSSVTLFPMSIIFYRLQQGAASPADVFIPILLATLASTVAGLLGVIVVQKINIKDSVLLLNFAGLFAAIAAFIAYLVTLTSSQLAETSDLLANFILLSLIISFLVAAHIKKVAVFDTFIEGAKEGFALAVALIPYMLAMLVAIAAFRASGALDVILWLIKSLVELFSLDTRFVDALPVALMQPFSGSGGRAMMIETMNQYGVDSFAGRLASIFQGSTETTFYVIAVYFGAVGIKHTRHAIGCGLFADACGIIAAIFIGYWFYG
ncbi:MAG: spore maturation protein [Psychrobium sp.]|nr:spore maturation protein [Psychrobium sp.]